MRNFLAIISIACISLSFGLIFGAFSGRDVGLVVLSTAVIMFIKSLTGGTTLQVAGPTAPLCAVILTFVSRYEGLDTNLTLTEFLNIIVVLSSVILLVLQFFSVHKLIHLIPNVVLSGFMNGIALIMSLTVVNFFQNLETTFWIEFVWFSLALLALFGLETFLKKFWRQAAAFLPIGFLVLFVSTIVQFFLNSPIETLATSGQLNQDFWNLYWWQWAWPESSIWLLIIWLAFELAFMVYLDTLMTAKVIDRLTNTTSGYAKELTSQASANILASSFSGLPGAQATERSLLLHEEKINNRYITAAAGLMVLVLYIFFQPLFDYLPQSVLMAFLLKVAISVIDKKPFFLYLKEIKTHQIDFIHHFWQERQREDIFVSNREIIWIIATSLATFMVGFQLSILISTLLFYLHNSLLPQSRMHDLQPFKETRWSQNAD